MIIMKICTVCELEKDDFGEDKRNKDGLKSLCKECSYKATNRWKSKNRPALRQAKNEWYRENKMEQLFKAKCYNLKKYGITWQDYLTMLAEQNGVCKICRQPSSNRFMLSVDHNHSTGKVRGLLCASCNFALGNMKDNPALLRKAAEYLEEM